MALEYTCPTYNGTCLNATVEVILKRAAARNHEHHGGSESITSEIEALLKGIVPVA